MTPSHARIQNATVTAVNSAVDSILNICHLDDVTHGLGDIDDAHQDQDQRHIQGVGQSADRAAQEQ